MQKPNSSPSSIIITGSKQGITNPPGNPAYNSSKATVKSLTEHLAHDLRSDPSTKHISVHLLIPGWTYTSLMHTSGPDPDTSSKPKGAWLPSQVADYAFKKMEEGRFYIVCPDNDVDEALDQARMQWGAEDVVEGRPALSRWDEGWKDQAAKWIGEEADRRRKG
jgi:short-subunit dehydrogenase